MSLEFDERELYKGMYETARAQIDQLKSDRRFTAAVAAMQGLLANGDHRQRQPLDIVECARAIADELLAELDRTKGGEGE